MSRKSRLKTLKQFEHAAGDIFKKFLAPLSRYKPDELDMGQFWECLFHVEERTIQAYKARASFKLPGLYYLSGNVKIQGVGPRQVKRGEYLFVRTSNLDPNRVDVEHNIRDEEHVFALNSSEWGWVRLKLEPVNYKKR